MSFSGEPAMSATKPTAKKDTKSSVAAADRPMVLSKFKKQRRAHATKKSRTAQARHLKRTASKVSSKAVAQKNTAKEAPADIAESELPPEVANAHAQALAEDQARNIAALDSTNVSTVNGILVAANDPQSDAQAPTDNAVVAQDPAPATPPAAAPEPPAPSGKIIRATPSAEKQVVKSDESDPWSKTSLIGKIFIAFGSLLTLASAARLLIA
ncbi:MAG: hypothetical protein ACRC9K_13185 [Afipia sp.]